MRETIDMSKKVLSGVVVSNVQDKTVVVKVTTRFLHPKYKKTVSRTKKYHAHDPENHKFNIGEVIDIEESRPISKTKKWCVIYNNKNN